MSYAEANIQIPVDLTNPGQFFACCGLLELADRLCQGAEGWFEGDGFKLAAPVISLDRLLDALSSSTVDNTMSPSQVARLEQLSGITKKDRTSEMEEEKKALESLRRELPIVIKGEINFQIDWFCDDFAGGSRFKTWAGRQSVLDIARAMHGGLSRNTDDRTNLWRSVRGIGLPFNFDSDLGGQGSALDIGFSFDPLAGNDTTRIEGTCRPTLELLAFIGLQRFRPLEIPRENRFVYVAWLHPLPLSVAACTASHSLPLTTAPAYEFRLLYRTKYLKSFLPAQPYQGDLHE